MNKSVTYVDFGWDGAQRFWEELVVPSYSRFLTVPNRANAIAAAWPAWHMHEWVWHDANPNVNTRDPKYIKFRDALLSACPALGHLRDVANASKHRGTSDQRRKVSAISGLGLITKNTNPSFFDTGPFIQHYPLNLVLADKTELEFQAALTDAVRYWCNQGFTGLPALTSK